MLNVPPFGSQSTQFPQTSSPDTSPRSTPIKCSNLLGRLLGEALTEAGQNPSLDTQTIDASLALKIVNSATPREIMEAQRALQAESNLDLFTLLPKIPESVRQKLKTALTSKYEDGLREVELPSSFRQREFVLREFERAPFSASSAKVRHYSVEEKLTILSTFVGMLRDGVTGYPEVLERFEQTGLGEKSPDCPLYLVRSLRMGRWLHLGRMNSCSDLLAKLDEQVAEVEGLLNIFSTSRHEITPDSAKLFVSRLDTVNRFAYDYGMDLVADAMHALYNEKPRSWFHQVFEIRSQQACQHALNAVLTRFFIIRRAEGVRHFVDEMQSSLKLVS